MRVTMLGCGASVGVPSLSGGWGRCDPAEPRNRRRRCSILVEKAGRRLLVDASPDLREQLLKQKSFGQGAEARDKLLAALLEKVEIPVPESLVEGEVHRHLENENRLDDDAHRAEVTESSTTTFRTQIFLDALAEKEEVKVSQDELTQYLIQGGAQYGMEPGEFIKILDQNGQIPGMVGEVARSKALSVALSKAKVVDSKGKAVDLTAFTAAAVAPVAEAIDEHGSDEHSGHDHDEHDGHDH